MGFVLLALLFCSARCTNALRYKSVNLKLHGEERPFWFQDKFPDPTRDALYKTDPWFGGPTQIDDLGVLYAAIKETRPKTIVEVGFNHGDGTRAMLSAVDSDTSIFSFDPSDDAEHHSKILKTKVADGQFTFFRKNGEEISAEDVGHKPVDFVFFDAGHQLTANQKNFSELTEPCVRGSCDCST